MENLKTKMYIIELTEDQLCTINDVLNNSAEILSQNYKVMCLRDYLRNQKLREQTQSKQFSLDDMKKAFDEGSNAGAIAEHLCEDYGSYEEIEESNDYFNTAREEFINSLK